MLMITKLTASRITAVGHCARITPCWLRSSPRRVEPQLEPLRGNGDVHRTDHVAGLLRRERAVQIVCRGQCRIAALGHHDIEVGELAVVRLRIELLRRASWPIDSQEHARSLR